MLIREVDPDRDAADAVAIYAPFVTESVTSFEEQVPSEAEFRRRMSIHNRTHAYLVAEDDGHVVGFSYAGSFRERTAYQWTCETSIYIAPTHHRRGLGRLLYGTLFDLLAQRGYRTLMAGITVPNAASIGLHEACGFTLVGSFPYNGFKAGEWREVAWMTRRIGDSDSQPPRLIGPPARLPQPITVP